ncbi:uncharacterized protein LOC123271145 [Cotesia glomerata]|uniref:uncharacterized protein LOC123271145 n=1 Tax=Cotesia glomerata TaxID=32391 RepID=UPI001D033754|nr:uncharacterized protein LOC123271145 [Cotesia glomerata]
MKFFRHFLILCLLFIIPWTHSELFKFRNFSLIHRKMESISMELCISGKLNPVVVSNDIRNVIGESLWTKKIIPTISVAENFGINNDSVTFSPKLLTYILSTNELQTVLQKIKSLPWWNIKSYFFIVEVSQICNDNNSWNILQIMWKMNFLSSLFICRDIDNTITLYTYNPYANYAPHPWQHVNTTFNQQGQQWTLFKKSDSSGISVKICFIEKLIKSQKST